MQIKCKFCENAIELDGEIIILTIQNNDMKISKICPLCKMKNNDVMKIQSIRSIEPLNEEDVDFLIKQNKDTYILLKLYRQRTVIAMRAVEKNL